MPEVNDHVQQITDAHTRHFGVPPSPGVVFDLIRATSIIGPNPNYDSLFGSVPKSKRDAFTNSISGGIQPQTAGPMNQDLMHEREDGLIVHPTPRQLPRSDTIDSLHKEFPTVQMGMIPAKWQNSFFDALNTLAHVPDNLQVTSLGQTLQEAEKTMELTGRSDLQSFLEGKQATTAITTVSQAQIHLNKMMGTNLPVTGYLNADWQKAISNWMKTRSYFQRTADYQASQAGFKTYGEYLHAFQTKQRVVQKHGMFGHFLNSLPVNIYADGGSPLQILKNLGGHPFEHPSFSVSYPLHILTRSGGEALDVFGGSVMQAKADLAAGNEFLRSVLPKDNPALNAQGLGGRGETFDEAKARAKKVLSENPTWMRIFMPDMPSGENEPGWLKAVDELTNFAGDLILLRKPILTGSVVRAGDFAKAVEHPYVNSVAGYSHAHIAKGEIGRAVALMEGGAGAEQLSVVTAQSIKKGWMSKEVFRDHVAELFSKGETTVKIMKPEKDTMVNVYHGTDVTADLSHEAADSGVFGRVVYVSPHPGYASSYADVRAVKNAIGPNVRTNVEHLGPESRPNVRLLKIDSERLYPYKLSGGETVDAPALIKKVLRKLTPEERKTAENLETMSLSEVKDGKSLYDYLATLGSRMENNNRFPEEAAAAGEKTIAESGTYGRDFANEVLQRAGYTGIKNGDNEIAVFDAAKALKPAFEPPIEVKVTGPVLSSLRSRDLITPSAMHINAKDAVRTAIDDFSKGAQQYGAAGTLSSDFLTRLRTLFSHAAPRGYRASYDPRLPERVHDFVMKHFNDPALANEMEAQVIRARALGNTPKIDKIMQKLHRLYYAKYPVGRGSLIEDDPFMPLLESEAGSRVFFPSGNIKLAKNPFEAASVAAGLFNSSLNFVGGKLRRILIISPALFWKHMIADSMRRYIGGGGFYGDAAVNPRVKKGLAEIDKLVNDNPEIARRWGTALDRVTNGEAHYMAKPDQRTVTFDTRKHFSNDSYMEAAGQYVRTMLDDKGYAAYKASSPENLQPLVDLIENSRVYRRLWSGRQKEEATAKYGKRAMADKVRIVDVNQGILQNKKEMLESAFSSHDYASLIYNRYKYVEEAANAQGQTLSDAMDVLRGHRGPKADQALGDWIARNKIDFEVEKGLVSNRFNFDSITSKLVQKIMYFNKANRNGMFRGVAARQYQELLDAGWEREAALATAIDVAEKQTIYHMLDFGNMLQAEQDFRWLSYFATKHRLYWKWVLSTMVHRPFVSAAIMDIKEHLDRRGNFNFKLFGHHLQIPAARLMWVTKEYPEESPLAGGLAAALKDGFSTTAFTNALVGSLGSGLQRNAVPAMMLVRAAKMDMGLTPATYTAATSGMDQTHVTYLNREINHFQLDYYTEHGHYAPMSEALKHSLYSLAAQEAWRSNLPLPVISYGTSQSEFQQMLDKFMTITDPKKRSKYLDDHPELQAQFGISSDPKDFLHYRRFWSQYTQALDQYHAAREEIYQIAKVQGMTAALSQQRRDLSKQFQKTFDKLKAEDLASTTPDRRREINGELLGLWGQQISTDPLVDPRASLHKMFPSIPKEKLEAGLPSQMIKDAKRELQLLNDPKWVAETFPDAVTNGDSVDSAEARARRSELLNFIQDFQPFAKDNLGVVEQKYVRQYVNPYWNKVEKMNKYIQSLPRGQKGAAYANLRDWKDLQNQPVVIDGVKFPAPIVAAWQNLPPDLRKARTAALATGSWNNLADYEKKLLGFHPAEFTSHGWAALADWRKSVAEKGGTVSANMIKGAVDQIDKAIPGFKKDFQLSQQPRLNLFEQSTLYKTMPPYVREFWNSVVSQSAHAFAKAVNDPNRSSKGRKDARLAWERAVNIVPTKTRPIGPIGQAILQDPEFHAWIKPYLDANTDFLNTIINKSYSSNG